MGSLHSLLRSVAVAAFLAGLVAEARADEWLPLAAGNRWSYVSEHDIQYKYPDRPIVRAFWAGTLEERVEEPRLGDPKGKGEILHRLLRIANEPSGIDSASQATRFLQWLSNADGLVRLHAIQAPDAPSPGNQPVRYGEPIHVLRPELGAGATWRVGPWLVGSLAVELSATVTGREDVVVRAGSYPNALVVRYAGPISGAVQVVGEWAEVESGRYERTWWLAAGVGIVKEDVEMVFHAIVDETTPVDGHMTTTRELREFKPAP